MKRGRMIRGNYFDVFVLAGRNDPGSLGLIVPKRLARLAVTRNAVKRQVRECYRCQGSALRGIDVVVRFSRMPTVPLPSDWKPLLREDIQHLMPGVAQAAPSGTPDL